MNDIIKKKPQRKRLFQFDYFRAYAILLIIFGHCYSNWKVDSLYEFTFINTVTGGTALFVFISGFFFHHIFYNKFVFKPFIQKKLNNIGAPFLFLSLLLLVLKTLVIGSRFIDRFDFLRFEGIPELSFLFNSIFILFSGSTVTAYWYIPFIFIIFLASPIFISFIKLKPKNQLLLTIIMFLVSMVFARPTANINPIHSVLYFTSFYLFGIMYSLNKKRVDDFIKGKTLYLLLASLAGSFLMSFIGQVGNLHRNLFASIEHLDYMVLQKILFIIFFMSFCQYLTKYKLKLSKYIADISFALFFLHGFTIWLIHEVNHLFFNFQSDTFFYVVVVFLLTIIIDVAVIFFVKTLFKNKSKYIIGY